LGFSSAKGKKTKKRKAIFIFAVKFHWGVYCGVVENMFVPTKILKIFD
jgi:hypothetical protein